MLLDCQFKSQLGYRLPSGTLPPDSSRLILQSNNGTPTTSQIKGQSIQVHDQVGGVMFPAKQML
jgi:hypothetical protein